MAFSIAGYVLEPPRMGQANSPYTSSPNCFVNQASPTDVAAYAAAYPSNELNPRNDYLVLLTSELAPGNTGTPVSIADVTNSAGLIFVSTGATPHNLNTGQTVIISGVVGVPAANGTWTITVVDAYNFTLAGSVFSGDYSSGGTVTGLDGGPGMLINAGFGWTKNEIVTRLGYDSKNGRFRTLPGGAVANLGTLAANANTTRIAVQPVPLNFSSGSSASVSAPVGPVQTVTGLADVGSASVGNYLRIYGTANSANDGNFLILSVISPSSVTIHNPGGSSDGHNGSLTWIQILTAAPYRLSVGSFGSGLPQAGFDIFPVLVDTDFGNPDPGSVGLSLATGNINWNPSDLVTYDGLQINWQQEQYFTLSTSTGAIGVLQTGASAPTILLNPIPAPGQFPLVRIGYLLWLTTVQKANESHFTPFPGPVSGTVEWAVTSGKLNFSNVDVVANAGTTIYYDGTLFARDLTLPRQSIGTVSLPSPISLPNPATGDLIFALLQNAPYYQFPQFEVVSPTVFASNSGEQGTVQINTANGAVQFSGADIGEYGPQPLTLISGDLPIERGISFRFFRSVIDLDAQTPTIKDVTAIYPVEDAVWASPIIGSPLVFLPVIPIDDDTLIVSIAQGTGSFVGELSYVGGQNPPTGYGYTIDFDTSQFNFAQRKSNVLVTLPIPASYVQLPDTLVQASNINLALETGPMTGVFLPLTPGDDCIVDPTAGIVYFTQTYGVDTANGSTGTFSGTTFTDTAAAFMTQGVVVGDFLAIESGYAKGVYTIKTVVSNTKITTDVPPPNGVGPLSYEILSGIEVMADRFFEPVLLVDPTTSVERINALGPIQNSVTIVAASSATFSNLTTLKDSSQHFIADGVLTGDTISITRPSPATPPQVSIEGDSFVEATANTTVAASATIAGSSSFSAAPTFDLLLSPGAQVSANASVKHHAYASIHGAAAIEFLTGGEAEIRLVLTITDTTLTPMVPFTEVVPATYTVTRRLQIPLAYIGSVRFRYGLPTTANPSGVFSTVVNTVPDDGYFTPPTLLAQGTVEVSAATGNLNFSQADIDVGGTVYVSHILALNVDYKVQPQLGFVYFTTRLLTNEEVLLTYVQAPPTTTPPTPPAPPFVGERGTFLVRKELTQPHPTPTSTLFFNPTGKSVALNPAPKVFRGGRPQVTNTQVLINPGNPSTPSSMSFLPDNILTDALPHGAIVGPTENVYIDYYVYQAMGGELSLTVLNSPMQVAQVNITDGATSFLIASDQTENFPSGFIMVVNGNEVYQIGAVTYDPIANMTTVNLGPTIAVSNVLNNKGVVQITSAVPHGLVTGQTVSVANVIGVPGATGQFTVTVLNSTNFLLNGTIYTGVYTTGTGTITLGSQLFQSDETNPPLLVASGPTPLLASVSQPSYFMVELNPFNMVARGVNTIVIPTDRTSAYQTNTVIFFSDNITSFTDFYLVTSCNYDATTNQTTVTLATNALRQYGYTTQLLSYSVRPIFAQAPEVVSTDFPPLSTQPITVIRRIAGKIGQLLSTPTGYTIDDSGAVTYVSPLQPNEEFAIFYTGHQVVQAGIRLQADYTCAVVPTTNNGILNQVLNANFTYFSPDNFYFRVEDLTAFKGQVAQEIQAAAQSGSPASGPMTSNSSSPQLYQQGRQSLWFPEGDYANHDLVAQACLLFFNRAVNDLEDVLHAIDGRIVGDRDGRFLFDGVIGRYDSFSYDITQLPPYNPQFTPSTTLPYNPTLPFPPYPYPPNIQNQIDDYLQVVPAGAYPGSLPYGLPAISTDLTVQGYYQQAYVTGNLSRFFTTTRNIWTVQPCTVVDGQSTGDTIGQYNWNNLTSLGAGTFKRYPRAQIQLDTPYGSTVFTVNPVALGTNDSLQLPAFVVGMQVVIQDTSGNYYLNSGDSASVVSVTATSITVSTACHSPSGTTPPSPPGPYPAFVPAGATIYVSPTEVKVSQWNAFGNTGTNASGNYNMFYRWGRDADFNTSAGSVLFQHVYWPFDGLLPFFLTLPTLIIPTSDYCIEVQNGDILEVDGAGVPVTYTAPYQFPALIGSILDDDGNQSIPIVSPTFDGEMTPAGGGALSTEAAIEAPGSLFRLTTTTPPFVGKGSLDVTRTIVTLAPTTTHTTSVQTLPQAIIPVASTTGFFAPGTALITTTAGVQVIAFTGITSDSLTGCTGGTGNTSIGGSVLSGPTAFSSPPPQQWDLVRIMSGVNGQTRWRRIVSVTTNSVTIASADAFGTQDTDFDFAVAVTNNLAPNPTDPGPPWTGASSTLSGTTFTDTGTVFSPVVTAFTPTGINMGGEAFFQATADISHNVLYAPINISNITNSGGEMEVQTASNHNLLTGGTAVISGVVSTINVVNVSALGGGIQITTDIANVLATGNTVLISGVVGTGGLASATNGTHTITVQDTTHFTLNTSVFVGAYTRGGIVEGVPGANGSWIVTVVDNTHFNLNGSAFSGLFISGEGTATGLLYTETAPSLAISSISSGPGSTIEIHTTTDHNLPTTTIVSVTNVVSGPPVTGGNLIEVHTASATLTAGQTVLIQGVTGSGGLPALVNSTFVIASILSPTSFTLAGTLFAGSYASGGTVYSPVTALTFEGVVGLPALNGQFLAIVTGPQVFYLEGVPPATAPVYAAGYVSGTGAILGPLFSGTTTFVGESSFTLVDGGITVLPQPALPIFSVSPGWTLIMTGGPNVGLRRQIVAVAPGFAFFTLTLDAPFPTDTGGSYRIANPLNTYNGPDLLDSPYSIQTALTLELATILTNSIPDFPPNPYTPNENSEQNALLDYFETIFTTIVGPSTGTLNPIPLMPGTAFQVITDNSVDFIASKVISSYLVYIPLGSSGTQLANEGIYAIGTVIDAHNIMVNTPFGLADIGNVSDNGGLIEVTTLSANTFATGDHVTIIGVTGTGGLATATNGTHTVTVVDSLNFTLNGSTFVGTYTSGGTAQVGGTVSYQIVSKFGSTTAGLQKVFSVLVANQTFVNSTQAFQTLVNATVDVHSVATPDSGFEYANGINDILDDLGNRYAAVSGRQASLLPTDSTGPTAIIQSALKSTDQLYSKRYAWINARINLQSGYLVLENQSVAARILQQVQVFNQLIQLLTVQGS